MKVNQIYSLLNDINGQMWGKDAVTVHDLSGIISMGDSIVGSPNNTDAFLGKLVDRIGKTVIRTLNLELDFPTLFMDSFEFGAILQKITVNPFDAIQSSEWTVGDNGFTPTLLDIHKPTVNVVYFKDSTTWKYQVTIPDDLFSTAFTSETAMSQFIDAIINSMTDSMTMSLNNMSRTAVNNLIAEKIKAGHNVIDLLALYNGASGTLTQAEAMQDKDFLRFAVNTIRKYIKYLREPSVLYNEGIGGNTVVRATASDNMHVLMLTEFVAGVESYLQSDTFHDELLGMPLYNEVAYWQANKGATDINDFVTNSTINVIPSSEAGQQTPTAVNQSGVICALADRQAVAIGLNKRRAGSFYNSIDAYSNISSTATIQYINDLSENVVIFVVGGSNSSNQTSGTSSVNTRKSK